jgi:hypothetical protein
MAARKTKSKKDKKGKKSEPRKVAVGELSDPRRWCPLPKTYEQLEQLLGPSTDFALVEALKNEELRCVHWPAGTNRCEEKQGSFWQSRQLVFYRGELKIYAPDPDAITDPRDLLDGWEFYVEKPWEVWRALVPQAAKEKEPESRKRGRKPMHPWKMFVAAKAWEMHTAGGQRQLAAYFAQLCGDKFEWQPDISEVNELLRVLDY